MFFGQLSNRESLHNLIVAMEDRSGKLYHLGIGIHAPYDTGKRGYFNIDKFKNALAFHLAIGYPF